MAKLVGFVSFVRNKLSEFPPGMKWFDSHRDKTV